MVYRKKKTRNSPFLSLCARFVCFLIMHDRFIFSMKFR
jgi:hypothetical protein